MQDHETLASKLLDVSDRDGIDVDPVFVDPANGNICRAFYALHETNRRRQLVCVTTEYAEDILTNAHLMQNSIAMIDDVLSNLSEKAKKQTENFGREEDFIFSR